MDLRFSAQVVNVPERVGDQRTSDLVAELQAVLETALSVHWGVNQFTTPTEGLISVGVKMEGSAA